MSIWDSGFEEPSVEFPERIVLDVIEPFENATEGLASLNLVELSDIEKIGATLSGCSFQYKVILTSDLIRGYSFEVMSFGYSVTIYPTTIVFEDQIGEELGIRKTIYRKGKYASEEDFRAVINSIFTSNSFRKIVGGLMKISRAQRGNT